MASNPSKTLLALSLAASLIAVFQAQPLFAEDPLVAKINKQAEEEAAKAFSEEFKAKIQKEALEKYPDYNVGESITVPVKFGKSSINRAGILKSVAKDHIVVSFTDSGDRKIFKNELPEEMITGVDGENYSYRSQYLQKNFYQARNLFKKASKDRLFHENGFIYDAETGRWNPKYATDAPPKKEEPSKAAKPDEEMQK